MLPSVSVVMIVGESCPSHRLLALLSDRLETLSTDFEFIFVANDIGGDVSLELKALIDTLPDSLAVFLGEAVHDDLARLVGIDHAVSDFVLFCTPRPEEIEHLGVFEPALRAGIDLVVADGIGPLERHFGRRILFKAFRTFFRWATGKTFEGSRTAFRIMSRAAALYVSGRTDGEVLVRARYLGSGFPASIVPVALPTDADRHTRRPTTLRDVARGLRLITTSSTALLRASAYIAVAGGVASTVYALYVIAIYALLPEVQPGWTTTSLQLSGMMLLFSVQFLLLSEHVIQIAASNPSGSRRHMVIREYRSPLSRRSARLNVVDQEGRFQLGAPPHLAPLSQAADAK